MNYIKKLEAKVADLEATLMQINEECVSNMVYLSSDKFTGQASDGERIDYVNSTEAYEMLQRIRCMTLEAQVEAQAAAEEAAIAEFQAG